jgi:hypothetical protein
MQFIIVLALAAVIYVRFSSRDKAVKLGRFVAVTTLDVE